MEKLIVIKTLDEMLSLEGELESADYVAFDIETTGLDRNAEVIGFSVSFDVEKAYYVVLSYWDTEAKTLVALETREEAAEFFTRLTARKLIMHNSVFDCRVVRDRFDVDLMPALFVDTMILSHLLNENRSNKLKDLGLSVFGEDWKQEQREMHESVLKNGGSITEGRYDLYMGDCDIIGKYGAKDAILTLKLFYELVPQLYDEGLDKFFFEDESMPMLKGPTYELNTVGLKVDQEKLAKLRSELEAECLADQAFIYKEIEPHIKAKYPAKSKATTFNIGSGQQLAWLLFEVLGRPIYTLTETGKEVCKALGLNLPYNNMAKREFIRVCKENKGHVYAQAVINKKTGKPGKPKVVGDFWKYTQVNKIALKDLAQHYKWVDKLLHYRSSLKILDTYVLGIQARAHYGVVYPSFLQHGTTSGRYASRDPNFQNLPRDDKRVKSCIVARPGKVFVAADQSQLEPRIFASYSRDERLMDSFARGEDFYAVVGVEVFDKHGASLHKQDKDSFAALYPDLRYIIKNKVALPATYGTTASQMAVGTGKTRDECQEIINKYFEEFPGVQAFMLESHEEAKKNGVVYSLFGRPRRMPKAMEINKIYGKNTKHVDLPYEARNWLNLSVNHRIQSTAASIMNRASIAFWIAVRVADIEDCHIVMQCHDELVIECLEKDQETVARLLKEAMEQTVTLPGVKLEAEPAIGANLAECKPA